MPNTDSKTYIVNDQPTEKDALDFTPYVETLADIIQTGNTPLTIGVFGTWGSGKTSLMKMVKNQLPNKFTVAWFDAWKYDKEETLWRAFLLSVLTAVRSTIKDGQPTEDLEYLETMLYRSIEIEKAGGVTIDLAKLGGAVAKGGIQLALSFIPGGAALSEFVKKVQELGADALTNDATEAIQRERTKIQIEQVRFLEQFQNKFRTLIEQHISNNGKRLVVFVDDLDRCLPEKAIEVLEAIKLFLDAENCVFILGLDQEVIARGIEMKYKELGARQDKDEQEHFTVEGVRYLEKIIQLPFHIPPVEESDMGSFVYELSTEWPHNECPRVFAEGTRGNPRQIKRIVNVFLMLWKLSQKRQERLQERIKPIRLAKVVLIQIVNSEFYSIIKENPQYLINLENYFRLEIQEAGRLGEKDSLKLPLDESEAELQKRRSLEIDEADRMKKDSDTDNGKEITNKDSERGNEVPAIIELPNILSPFSSNYFLRRILTMHTIDVQDANFCDLRVDDVRLYFTLTRRIETPSLSVSDETKSIARATKIKEHFPEPEMIRIRAGAFRMGTSKEQTEIAINAGLEKSLVEREFPRHIVELSEFYIGKYLITNMEYQEFLRETGYPAPSHWSGNDFPSGKINHPVVHISLEDANKFCLWLRKKTSVGFRLPTEAEWEKAARGTDSRIYPWGNKFIASYANTKETRINDTTPVGYFSSSGDSPYGCADMCGNVWEWCSDWLDEDGYMKRASKLVRDPQGPNNGYSHVLRGGSYKSSKWLARLTSRPAFAPSAQIISGFRVAYTSSEMEVSTYDLAHRYSHDDDNL